MKNKAQEEIVGFAMIVIVIAVILLIVLAFYLRSPSQDVIESVKTNNFFYSLMRYTTDCEKSIDNYLEIEDLIEECSENRECLDGRNSCVVLEGDIQDILDASWIVGPDSPYRGYKFEIVGDSGGLLTLEKGNLTGERKGARNTGEFNVTFDIYSIKYED